MLVVKAFNATDDLTQLVEHINAATWDDANDMGEYQVDALQAYLQRPDTLFIACYRTVATASTFLGMASARLQIKPYDFEQWLYVDEVDVCTNHRRNGAASAMMNYLLEYAADHDCCELWLGTEIDNHPAQALYRSLDPDEEERFVGYTYEIESTDYQ